MKAKYILSSLLLAGCTFFSSCEDNLDISQHGVSTFENFYKREFGITYYPQMVN